MARGIASSCPPGRALARSAALAALAAGAAAALPASAGAATVTVGHEPGLKYVAGGGEVNRLAVSAADGWLLLSDPGADAIALAGAGAAAACEQIAPTRVRCREDAFTKVKATCSTATTASSPPSPAGRPWTRARATTWWSAATATTS